MTEVELFIIVTQAVMLVVSEIMPFLNTHKNGIVDGIIKMYKSECCEDEIPAWLTPRKRRDAECALQASAGLDV